MIENEQLLKEWNYEKNGDLTPQMVTHGSNKKVWWKCSKCSEEWQAKVGNRSILGRGCPYCTNQKIRVGKNDLATTHPQLAAEWDYEKNDKTPQEVTYGSGKKVWWKCPFGHSYQANPLHRTVGSTNCPICNSGRQTSFAEQAFYFYIKKLYPDAINRYTDIFDNRMELDIFIPSIRLAIEYDGEFWHKNKRREEIKYKYCQKNNIELIRIKEDSAADCWDIADQIYHTDNLEDRKNLENLIKFFLVNIDLCRGTFMFREPNVDLERDRNKILNLYRAQQIKRSLVNTHPKLVEEWNYERNGGLLPAMFQSGSDERVWWKCSICGHEWQASIYHRAHGTGCNVCYRKRNWGGAHAGAKEIYQFSVEGKFIKKWDCIAEASRELNINPSNIWMCAKHTRSSAGGFRWEFQYIDELNSDVQIGHRKKAILQLDNDGKVINEYHSIREAAQKLGIAETSISKVLHGEYKKAGGYGWRVKNSD